MQESQAPWATGAELRSGFVPRKLMQRLLGALRKRPAAQPLQPAGQRSGRGAKSLEPYLEEARKSRPASRD